MKVYLIANNGYLDEQHIDELNIEVDRDIVVLLNYMYVPYEKLKSVKNKICFLRTVYVSDKGNDYYLGGNEFLGKQESFKNLVCVDNISRYVEYTKNIKIPTTFLDTLQLTKQCNIEYVEDKTPTTGFIAYLYMTHNYPLYEPVLVGFTGHYADGTEPDKSHHDYEWEQKYYKSNNVKSVFNTLRSYR